MEALILAAGVGARLAPVHAGPKALIDFGGRSLLARHLAVLKQLGVERATICVGHCAGEIEAATATLEAKPDVRFVLNQDFREGSIRSLWTARTLLQPVQELLLMDADVLYAPALLARLVTAEHRNCLLFDRRFEPGEEPVKVRMRAGRVVEFSKHPDPTVAFETEGESVGFFKLHGAALGALWELADSYVARGDSHLPHEEALRELFLAGGFPFGVEDITGLPWMEIDFPCDLERARREVLPEVDRE